MRSLEGPGTMISVGYRCATCSELHEGLPDVSFVKPDPWFAVPQAERDRRVLLAADTCVIDDVEFFVRGVLFVPLVDAEGSLGLGVWVSQKRENFARYLENFDSADIGPYFGWLATRIRSYDDDTFALRTMVHFQGGDVRPSIVLEASDHPLSVDQREGITLAKAWEIVHRCGG